MQLNILHTVESNMYKRKAKCQQIERTCVPLILECFILRQSNIGVNKVSITKDFLRTQIWFYF